MRKYSQLFNEHYTLLENGTAAFDSGVIYTDKELGVMKKLDEETKKYVHMVKTVIGGTIEGIMF